MSSCLKISLLTVPSDFPDNCLDADGCATLRLASDLEYTKAKASTKLNSLGNFINEAALEIAVPKNDEVNVAILRAHGLTSMLKPVNNVLVPIVAREKHIILDYDVMCVVGNDSKDWTIQLLRSAETWELALQAIKVNELYAGSSFTYTKANLEANWATKAKWLDDEPVDYYFPLVDTGNWVKKAEYTNNVVQTRTEVSVGDFEPWFHVLPLLRKAFKQIGYAFRSPLLETEEFGRRIIAHIAKDRCKTAEINSDKFLAYVDKDYYAVENPDEDEPFNSFPYDTSNQNFRRGIFFIDDNENGYDYTDKYSPVLLFMPPASFNFRNYASGLEGPQTFRAVVHVTNDGNEVNECGLAFTTVDILTTTFNSPQQVATTANVILQPGESATLILQATLPMTLALALYVDLIHPTAIDELGTPSLKILNGSYFTNEDFDNLPVSGATKDFSTIIEPTLTAHDILLAVYELYGTGKILTDKISKTIYLYTDNDVTLWSGQVVKGFYTLPQCPEAIVCSSLELSNKPADIERYHIYSWAKTDDAYSEQLGYGEDGNLNYGAMKIDLGDTYSNNDEAEITNSLFEATINKRATSIAPAAAPTNGPSLMTLWDNTDNEKMCKVNPRLAIAHGLVSQSDDGSLFKPTTWMFEGELMSQVPYAYFDAKSIQLIDNGTVFYPKPTLMLSGEDGLFNVLYRTQFYELIAAPVFSARLVLSNEDYEQANFRAIQTLKHENELYVGKLLELTEQDPCTNEPLTATYRAAITNPAGLCDLIKNITT